MTRRVSGTDAVPASSLLSADLSRRDVVRGGLVAGAAGVAALSRPAIAPAQGEGPTLTVAVTADASTLDPHVSSVTRDSIFMYSLFDYLIQRAPDGTLYPHLATEWSVAEDGVTWTLKLRTDVVFHDGTPFNAEAVVFNLDRMVDPATASEYAVFQLGPYQSSRAIDDATVEITMSRPYGPLPASLATFGIAMVSPTAARAAGETFGQAPVGSGPFRFESWTPQAEMVFVRNPDYAWPSAIEQHTGPALLERVVFRTIPEAATRSAALQSGEVDFAFLTAPDLLTFEGNSDFTVQAIALEGYPPASLFLNTQRAPTDDLLVRQALNHAVDTEEVRAVIYENYAEPADNVMSTFAWAYNPAAAMYGYDPERAGALLDQAGWVMGDGDYRQKDGAQLDMVFLSLTGVRNVAELVQAQLRAVGINAELLVQDNPAQQQTAQTGGHNLVWTQWGGVDPADLKKVYGSENIGSGWNFSHYDNPELDQMFLDGEALNDQEQRREIYDQVQMTLMGDATLVPLNNNGSYLGYKSSVTGTEVITTSAPRLYNVTIA